MKSYIIILFILTSCSSGSMKKYYFNKNKYSWKAFQTKDFIVYYQENSQVSGKLAEVERKISKGLNKAKEVTRIDSIKTLIYFFVVEDKEQFKELTHLDYTGVAFYKSNTIVESYFLLGESHEIVHLISRQHWGKSHNLAHGRIFSIFR